METTSSTTGEEMLFPREEGCSWRLVSFSTTGAIHRQTGPSTGNETQALTWKFEGRRQEECNDGDAKDHTAKHSKVLSCLVLSCLVLSERTAPLALRLQKSGRARPLYTIDGDA